MMTPAQGLGLIFLVLGAFVFFQGQKSLDYVRYRKARRALLESFNADMRLGITFDLEKECSKESALRNLSFVAWLLTFFGVFLTAFAGALLLGPFVQILF